MTLSPYLMSWSKKKHALVSSKLFVIISVRNCENRYNIIGLQEKLFIWGERKSGGEHVSMHKKNWISNINFF